jgi:leucyl aminopeptidase (aminopeptidase T)
VDDVKEDLKKAAGVFIKELLNVRPQEKLLIYVDKGSDFNVVSAIQAATKGAGGTAEQFELDPNLETHDVVRNLTRKIEDGAFDVICELSEQYFYQTTAWQRALEKGARIYSLGGLQSEGLIRCFGNVNHALIYDFGTSLREILWKAKSVQILTKKGTDIKFEMNISLVDRVVSKLTGKKRPYAYITRPSGKLTHDVPATFLGGQIAFNGIPETIEGTAVIDGYVWPPQEIGHLNEPINLKIRKGRVTEVNDDSLKSKIFGQWLKGKKNEIKHFCIGFHPSARLSEKLIEAERVFGYISIGIGEYPFHTDGVITKPTLLLNREIIEKDGSFIHKELSILEKDLIQKNRGKEII